MLTPALLCENITIDFWSWRENFNFAHLTRFYYSVVHFSNSDSLFPRAMLHYYVRSRLFFFSDKTSTSRVCGAVSIVLVSNFHQLGIPIIVKRSRNECIIISIYAFCIIYIFEIYYHNFSWYFSRININSITLYFYTKWSFLMCIQLLLR